MPECGGKRKRGPPPKVFTPKKRNVQDPFQDGGGPSTSSMPPPTRLPPLARPPQRSYKRPNNNKTPQLNNEDSLDEILGLVHIPELLEPFPSESTQNAGEEVIPNIITTIDKNLSALFSKKTSLSAELADAEKVLVETESGIAQQQNQLDNLEKMLGEAREALKTSMEKVDHARLGRESAKNRLEDHQKLMDEIESLFLNRFRKQ